MENYIDPSLYILLKVKPTATKNQVKIAYYKLIKIYHPDKNKGNEALANENTQLLNFAYDILSNDVKRADYDRLLKEYAERKAEPKMPKPKPRAPVKKKTPAPSVASSSKEVQTQPRKRDPQNQELIPKLFGLAAWALLAYALSDKKKKR